tara:strand:- start:91 stop:858 length:768 start_codon:yes stop_codon:yes gene_type:complete
MRLLTYKNIKYFQSDLLRDNNFKHAFFTKRSNKKEPIELQNQLNLTSNIHYLKQIHSDKVIQVNKTLNLKPKIADSLITREKNQSLWIYTADCLPILIADIKRRNIAACHSGLNGLKKQIISKTLKKLEGIGSKKNNLIIAVGPCIKADKYQVKRKDVEDLIFQISGKNYIEKSFCIIESKRDKGDELIPLFKKDSNPDRLLLNIQAAAILQLFKEGIKRNQINLNRLCTYSNPTLFNSYRRDKTNLRQWSCIYS